MKSKKTYRNGNSVLESASDATGPKAETLRGVIRWNEHRAKLARKKNDSATAARHDGNKAGATLALVKLAQEQRS